MKNNIVSRNLIIVVCFAVATAAAIIAGGLAVEQQEIIALQNSVIGTMANLSSPTGNGIGNAASGPAASSSTSVSHAPSGIKTRVPVAPRAPFVIAILTPTAGNTWQIGKLNSISWSRAANITGEIDLLDAGTQEFIGVITSNTGPQQTSYGWDTRQIYLERYGALKKDIVPGTYFIQLKFDGNNLPNIVSGAVKITL